MTKNWKISWSDIEERHKNGIILGYYVRVVPEEQNLRFVFMHSKMRVFLDKNSLSNWKSLGQRNMR